MVYYWWLLAVATPFIIVDLLLRDPAICHPGIPWPLGLEYLAREG